MKILMRLGLATALAGLPLAVQAESLSPNLKFNGFATASTAWLEDAQGGEYLQDFFGHPGLTEDPDFGLESVLGLQFDYRINDKTNVVAQLLSQGRGGYATQAEWAYIGHELNDSLRLRAGRFALPLFLYSETAYVGQSYPWARLPVETYAGVPLTNFDGVDLLHRLPLGDWNLNTQVFTGSASPVLEFDGASTKGGLRKGVGLNFSLANDSLTLRAGYMEGKVSITLPSLILVPAGPPPAPALLVPFTALNLNDAKISFASLGALYDDGQWFLALEGTHFEFEGWWPDTDTAYVSAGHYFGQWLPFVLASKANTYNFQECTAIEPFCTGPGGVSPQYREQTTYALGTSYALSSAVSLKGQVDHVTDFNATSGYLSGAATTPPESFNVFTLSLTALF